MLPIYRRAAAAAALALAALSAVPRSAAAQTVSVGFSPSCGATACSILRFSLANPGTTGLTFNALGFSLAPGSTFTFAPAPNTTTQGSFNAEDSLTPLFGPLQGVTTIGSSGHSVSINFANDVGFPFQLDAGATGAFTFVELAVTSTAPALTASTFRFTASFEGGGSVSDVVSVAPTAVVPEPATVVLVAGGLAGLAAAARRRRAA
jgi:hypothetical protein